MIDLHHGDCLEVMPTLADDSVDLVLTDIPYGEVNRASAGLRNLDKGVADVVEFDMARMLSEVVRLVSGSGHVSYPLGVRAQCGKFVGRSSFQFTLIFI